jgi:hypothetical protein
MKTKRRQLQKVKEKVQGNKKTIPLTTDTKVDNRRNRHTITVGMEISKVIISTKKAKRTRAAKEENMMVVMDIAKATMDTIVIIKMETDTVISMDTVAKMGTATVRTVLPTKSIDML